MTTLACHTARENAGFEPPTPAFPLSGTGCSASARAGYTMTPVHGPHREPRLDSSSDCRVLEIYFEWF
jgi:hypothetical protein